ncbi:hypothetical protein RB195_005776 [Necator americanus]|uniref:Uncharacterized protein n=1 Tax=Necator americanus TaxID=51031 RepID=A0ABR1BPK4_NECAM
MGANAAQAVPVLLFISYFKSFSTFTERPSRRSLKGAGGIPGNLYDPRHGVDAVQAAEPLTESSLFLRLGFIQRPRYGRGDELGEYFVQPAQQACRTVVPKVPSVTFLMDKNGAEGEGEEWPNEVTGSRENRQDGWVYNKTNTAYISRRNFLSTSNECAVIHLSYVAPSALGLLQRNHVKLGSSEKSMQTVSMPSRACVTLVRLGQPEISSPLTGRLTVRRLRRQGPVYRLGFRFESLRKSKVGMSDVSNTTLETLPDDEPPLCIVVRRP